MLIRPFDLDRDLSAVRECFVELQDLERGIDPRVPAGSEIAEEYLDLMFDRCRRYAGRVLVAEVAGFVTVHARFRSEEPDDGPMEFALVSDLAVLAASRRRGIGRKLLEAAEAYAHGHGARWLRLSMKTGNEPATALYAKAGFRELEVHLEKALA
jgi:ribosomal protein S18 acetylase RimI-like enzyme